MRSVDTNVLVRLAARDDARQAATADRFIEPGAWVSVLALAEAVWVLDTVYERSPKELAAAIATLLGHRDLIFQDADAISVALDRFKAKPALGFSDCLLLELARKAGQLPLGTFDRQFARVPGAQKI